MEWIKTNKELFLEMKILITMWLLIRMKAYDHIESDDLKHRMAEYQDILI